MKNPKLILSQNLKKSLRDNRFLQPRRNLMLLLGCVWITAELTQQAIGRPPHTQPKPSDTTQNTRELAVPLDELLQHELRHAREAHLAAHPLFQNWKKHYGHTALPPLHRIASDSSLLDADRYTALLGIAYLGGGATLPHLLPFLKDPSWMMRGGALRALAQVGNAQIGAEALPLLNDPDASVRIEAIETIKILQPAHSLEALQDLANNKMSHFSKQQRGSVKERALQALALFQN